MKVRAAHIILDEGRIFAVPGDIGVVLDSERYAEGVLALTVAFPGAPGATTCCLGEDVEPLLAVVGQDSELLMPEPQAALSRAPTPRRARHLAAAVSVAALVVFAFWVPYRTSRAPVVDLAPITWHDEVAVDVAQTRGALHLGPKLPATAREGWKRRPCDRGELEVNGACFVVMEQRPPCATGYEHDGRCLMPIGAAPRMPSSIDDGHR